MPFYSGIPVDEGTSVPFYSTNRLQNGDAETGVTTPWTVQDVEVLPGGVDTGSQYAFSVNPGGNMSQTIINTGAHPPDYLLRGAFLPEKVLNSANPTVKAYAKVTVRYGDGSYDEIVLPVRRPIVPLPNVGGQP